jgi:hypothetical protein
MCGRYVRRSDKQYIAEHFQVHGPLQRVVSRLSQSRPGSPDPGGACSFGGKRAQRAIFTR